MEDTSPPQDLDDLAPTSAPFTGRSAHFAKNVDSGRDHDRDRGLHILAEAVALANGGRPIPGAKVKPRPRSGSDVEETARSVGDMVEGTPKVLVIHREMPVAPYPLFALLRFRDIATTRCGGHERAEEGEGFAGYIASVEHALKSCSEAMRRGDYAVFLEPSVTLVSSHVHQFIRLGTARGYRSIVFTVTRRGEALTTDALPSGTSPLFHFWRRIVEEGDAVADAINPDADCEPDFIIQGAGQCTCVHVTMRKFLCDA